MLKLGLQAVMELLESMPTNESFKVWLASVLEVTGGAGGLHWGVIPDGEFEETGQLSLAGCPLDHSRAEALRAVEFH